MTADLLARNVLTILRGICYHDKDCKESFSNERDRLFITFEPHPGDMSHCVGDGARCIKGLQHIARVIGNRNGYQPSISLIQPYKRLEEREDREFEQNPEFDETDIRRIVPSLIASAFGRQPAIRWNRCNDRLEIKTDPQTAEERVIVSALNEPLYAYGIRQGCIIKLSALNHEKEIA